MKQNETFLMLLVNYCTFDGINLYYFLVIVLKNLNQTLKQKLVLLYYTNLLF